ncbi:MAG TPA: hypothetical protein VGG39_21085 [Polyangiaceae bacterium]|jgi:hypothetical protein
MIIDKRWLRVASRKAACVWGLTGIAAAIACGASIDTKKVPSRTQYSGWTDERQKEADEIQGFRYYLPRPYIVVKREFPWTTKSIVVPGAVSADGKYILLDPKTLAAAGLNALPDATYPVFANGAALPVLGGSGSAPQGNAARLQGDVTDAGGDAAPSGQDAGGDGASTGTGSEAGTEAGAAGSGSDSGMGDAGSSFTISGSSTDHTVKLSDYMDLLYGPDFDEQYAVKPSGGITKEDFAMKLGNGWMAETVNASIDNTAIGSFVFDQLGKTFDLVRSAAKAIPGVGSVLQGEVLTADAGQPSGQKALVKITTIDYVVPGVYPIYKPRELMECVARSQNAAATAAGSPACNSGSPLWGDVLRFHTRTDVVLQLVTTAPPTNDASGQSAASTEGSVQNSASTNNSLKAAATKQLQAVAPGVAVNDVLGDTASGVVSVTLSCGGYANAAAAKAPKLQATRALTVKTFQAAMPSAKTVRVTCDNGM